MIHTCIITVTLQFYDNMTDITPQQVIFWYIFT